MAGWQTIEVRTSQRQEMVDITDRVEALVKAGGVSEGQAVVYVRHTTAAVTINEGADPAVKADIIMALNRIVNDDWPFRHAEGNSPAHVKTTLVGPSVVAPVTGGRLGLGTWQRIFLCEFDGPRQRRVAVRIS